MNPLMLMAATVFGLPLGQPFTVPECPKDVGEFAALCAQSYDQAAGGGIFLNFPTQATPAVMSSSVAVVTVKGGNLVGVEFNTLGVTNQDFVLVELSKKYGKPTAMTKSTIQNISGAEFTRLHATWSLPDSYVDFDSAPLTIDLGLVTIVTPAEKRAKDAAEAQKAASRTKL